MKKVLFILFNLLTITVMAQNKGRFEVHDLGNYKLHVYYTNITPTMRWAMQVTSLREKMLL